MTIHYHGTPITPNAELLKLAGRNFCISFGTSSKAQTSICHKIGQSVLIDNGAFSMWKRGEQRGGIQKAANGGIHAPNWDDYYEWASIWTAYKTSWIIIPDVIDGGSQLNDLLVRDFPRTLIPKNQAAPVWHMDEPVQRLMDLIRIGKWEKICIGSSGRYAHVGSDNWHRRMDLVFNKISDPSGRVPVWLHMLRGMNMVSSYYPFASVDSTDVARNYKRSGDVVACAARWDAIQCPPGWVKKMEQSELDLFEATA